MTSIDAIYGVESAPTTEVPDHVTFDRSVWCPQDGGWHPTVSRIFEDELSEVCAECGKEVA